MANRKPFWLAIGPDDTSEIFETEGAAMSLRGFTEAIEVYHCTPDENRMRPVTEDLAAMWWLNYGRSDTTVPDCYVQWLEEEIADSEAEHMRSRRHGREIGSEFLHNPQSAFGTRWLDDK